MTLKVQKSNIGWQEYSLLTWYPMAVQALGWIGALGDPAGLGTVMFGVVYSEVQVISCPLL